MKNKLLRQEVLVGRKICSAVKLKNKSEIETKLKVMKEIENLEKKLNFIRNLRKELSK